MLIASYYKKKLFNLVYGFSIQVSLLFLANVVYSIFLDKKNTILNPYRFCGSQLHRVPLIKNLGIYYYFNFPYKYHTDFTVGRAFKVFGFITNLIKLFRSIHSLITLHCSCSIFIWIWCNSFGLPLTPLSCYLLMINCVLNKFIINVYLSPLMPFMLTPLIMIICIFVVIIITLTVYKSIPFLINFLMLMGHDILRFLTHRVLRKC